ncbi:leucine-rich repeat domain-containing protein [Flavobacterium sp. GNP001]
MKQKNFLLFLLLSLHFIGFAQADFTQGNLRFIQIAGTNNVSVQKAATAPTGTLIIPATVTDNGNNYNVTTIPTGGFGNCIGLTAVVLPNSITIIPGNSFRGCTSLTSITIPNSVTSIGIDAFRDCTALTSVVLSSSISGIGLGAFNNCSSLQSITLPGSILGIPSLAFRNCFNLTSITVLAVEPPVISASSFSGLNLLNVILKVPSGTANLYDSATIWTDFGTITESELNNFTIANNTNLVTTGNVSINYSGGQLTNNGTITNPSGTLVFSAPVLFAGSGTTNTQRFNTTHLGFTRLNNRINVTGSVDVSNGRLNANNNLTLISNAAGSAVIAPLAGTSTITGKVTVQRYIPQGKRAFRFLSPGVTTDNFISNNWQLGTHITGSTTGANGFDATGTGSPSLFTYNNNQATGSGWTAVTSTDATNLQAGQGYRLLVRGDRNVNINSNSLPTINAAVTLSTTGNISIGNVVFDTALNATSNLVTNGYSLVGNPYVNTVDWNALTKVGLTDSYYIWDPNMGTAAQRGRYVVYSSTTGSSNVASAANQYIQPGQAFFVQNSVLGTPGTLTFQESNKVGNGNLTSVFRTQKKPMARLDLSVYETSELTTGGFPIDATVAVFDAAFSADIDKADVAKLSTGTENLSISNNTKTWAIDARGPISEKDEVLLNLQDFQANKNYSFRTQFSNFDASVSPFLVDKFLGTSTAITTDSATTLNFTTTAAAASYASDRFKIAFTNKTLDTKDFEAAQLQLYPNPVVNGQFSIDLPNTMSGTVNVKIINLIGQTVYETNTEAKNSIRINTQSPLPQAVYLVQLTNNGERFTKKITVN